MGTEVRRRTAVGVGVVVMALVASGCGSRRATFDRDHAGTSITFAISVSDEERPAIQELVRRFQNRSNARVNLELLTRFRSQPASRIDVVTSLDADQLIDTLVADAATGAPTVHLFAQDNLALKPLVDRQLVDDLSEVPIPASVIGSMVPPRFEGRQLFLPFRPNVRVTYVDQQVLDKVGSEAPATVPELVAVARKLKEETGRAAMTLSLAEGNPAAVTVSEWIVSFGGDPLVLNDEGSVRAFEVLQQLWQEGLLARESLFAKFDTEVDYLMAGPAAMAQNWSFTSAVLAEQGQLERFHVYAGWRGPQRAAHVIGGDVLAIPRGVTDAQREVALALAEYLMSNEAQELLVQENAWPSIRTDAYGDVPQAQWETFTAIQEALADGWFRPVVSYWPDVTVQMNEAVDRILLRNQPVRPVLDELHTRVGEAARRSGESYPP